MEQSVGILGMPGVGFFADHWSSATTLTLYWCENLIGSVLIGVRIFLHRRLTKKAGHYRDQLAARIAELLQLVGVSALPG